MRAAVGLAALTASTLLGGCSSVPPPHEPYEPASVGAATADGVKPVTLTEEGARRVGLATSSVTTVGSRSAVDYAALIYDSSGATWVYTAPEPLTFLRFQVEVAEVEQNRVVLTAGPPLGSAVVTVGAAELYGEELGISGKH